MSNWYMRSTKTIEAGKATNFIKGLGLSLPAAMLLPLAPQSAPAQQLDPPAHVRHVDTDTAPTDNTIAPQAEPAAEPDTQADMFVARVLFSETASVSPQERLMVASVMKNRIGKKDFGGFSTMRGVCGGKNAFEAVNDPKNSNWLKNVASFTPKEKAIWEQCVELSKGTFTPVPDILYYHDHSLSHAPKNWSKYYNLSAPITTKHFNFYKATPRR